MPLGLFWVRGSDLHVCSSACTTIYRQANPMLMTSAQVSDHIGCAHLCKDQLQLSGIEVEPGELVVRESQYEVEATCTSSPSS